jgi:hypothetical protein
MRRSTSGRASSPRATRCVAGTATTRERRRVPPPLRGRARREPRQACRGAAPRASRACDARLRGARRRPQQRSGPGLGAPARPALNPSRRPRLAGRPPHRAPMGALPSRSAPPPPEPCSSGSSRSLRPRQLTERVAELVVHPAWATTRRPNTEIARRRPRVSLTEHVSAATATCRPALQPRDAACDESWTRSGSARRRAAGHRRASADYGRLRRGLHPARVGVQLGISCWQRLDVPSADGLDVSGTGRP